LCGEKKLRSEFLLPGTTKVIDKCNDCLRKSISDGTITAVNAKREGLTREALAMFVAEVRGEKLNAPHITELVDEMTRQFGGLVSFCKEWKYNIDKAVERQPGSKPVLDAYAGLSKLIVESTAHRKSAPDVASCTDDEIVQELMDMAMQAQIKALNNGPGIEPLLDDGGSGESDTDSAGPDVPADPGEDGSLYGAIKALPPITEPIAIPPVQGEREDNPRG